MKDYKSTLNLPHTDFPMKANLPRQEPERLAFWQDSQIYQKLRIARKNDKKFILHDGPPYANGKIHLGHAVNKVLKDIIIKSKSLDGLNVPYVPGWDCHGLPIELNVEKKLGKNTVGDTEFRKACRDYALTQIDGQRNAFKRLGILGDWDKPYLTMDFSYEANIIRSLKKIIENGHLHRGFKPVHWCVECGSALAEAEVEYKNKSSRAIDVRFRVIDEANFLNRFNTMFSAGKGAISIPIWTTTPWTLPANQAVALNSKLIYVLAQVEAGQGLERLFIAKDLLESTLQRYGIADATILSESLGENLEGILLQHPFNDRAVPIVLGEHVTLDAGTGAVHTAPAHGLDDYIVAIHYNLPLNNPVDARGCFLPQTPVVAGQHVSKANDYIVALLKDQGMLLHVHTLEHSYPHCWRHKTPLIFRATPQWFIGMDQNGLRENALNAIDQVNWLPDWGKARIFGMIEQRPDWCISRQRHWCTPMALFLHKETGSLHPETPRLLEEVAAAVEKNGIEAWYEISKETLLGKAADQYEKSLDTLDVWFDSGVSHMCVLLASPELQCPADLYLEGSDQHRGWFQSSLLSATAMYGHAPYKTVLTHGFTVDAQGHKMSKSLGNVIEPEKIIDTLGADILRLWIATTDYRAEMAVSEEILKRTADTYRRIRNTARFLLANLHDFDPTLDCVPAEKLLSLDRFAIAHAMKLQKNIQKAYDDYQFHWVCQQLHHFCTIDMGSFYLDIIKDRQYTVAKNAGARRSAQTAMYHILQILVRCMAPILSFTAEEIWQHLPKKTTESIFLSTWYEQLPLAFEQDPLANTYSMLEEKTPTLNCLGYWQVLMRVREAINKEIENLRNQGQLGSALEAEVTLYFSADSWLLPLLSALGDELRFVLITSQAKLLIDSPSNESVPVTLEYAGMKESFDMQILPSKQPKCIRCWHRRSDVGQNSQHPEICLRCVENVENVNGEERCYA
jgi:isoleucyl-tRNA synthetase